MNIHRPRSGADRKLEASVEHQCRVLAIDRETHRARALLDERSGPDDQMHLVAFERWFPAHLPDRRLLIRLDRLQDLDDVIP